METKVKRALLSRSPALQLYGQYHEDSHAASFEDFLGELDQWRDTNYVTAAKEARFNAAVEAVQCANLLPEHWFGFYGYGSVKYQGRGIYIVRDAIGTIAQFDTAKCDTATIVAHLVLSWEEWE